jgi:hypothetical protein
MKKIDIPIFLEVYFDEEDENVEETFNETLQSKEFQEIIKTEVLERVSEAISEDRAELVLFRLVFYNLDLAIEKKQYKKILNTILNIYEQEEDYLKCIEIKTLIDKL